MFTGIVEAMGTVRELRADADGTTLMVHDPLVRDGLALGESVCIDGACLTVTELAEAGFSVGVSPETLRRTSLGERRAGDRVNLERAVLVGGRMGGHYVQGHVDGVGHILDAAPDGEAVSLRVQTPSDLLPYIVEKGFIAIDGTSLTVTGRGDDWFAVMLIPYTQQAVTLAHKPVGAAVNLEVDVVAKYVESLLEGRFDQHR